MFPDRTKAKFICFQLPEITKRPCFFLTLLETKKIEESFFMDHVLVISLSVEIIAVRQYPCDGFMDFERNAYKKKIQSMLFKEQF